VFFRASTKRIADKYGITGWVRNLPDGRVEGIASGEGDHLGHFQDWLNQGPKSAEVTHLEIKEIEYRELNQFEVL
jgi:acylphosphatase